MEVAACWEEIGRIARALQRKVQQEGPRPQTEPTAVGAAGPGDRNDGSREERSPPWSSECTMAA
jgi:hypothetical protein